MIKSRTTVLVSLGVVFVGALVGVFWLWLTMPPKVGIVRVADVLEKFDGAIQAKKDFQHTTIAWQANIDTLRSELQGQVLDFERDRSQLSEQERRARQEELQQKSSEIEQYTGAVQEKAAREQSLLTEGVVNQIKTAAEVVAKSQGFDVVHALQADGAILYSSESVDITEEVLEYLRAHYRGGASTTRR